jgi:hypothetical protein
VLTFALLAPVSLAALPFAALLVAARPGAPRQWLAAALAGCLSAGLLVRPEAGLLDGLTRAWIVLVSVAFAAQAALRPGGGETGFWPLALRACLYAAAGVALLGRAVAGGAVWSAVQWDATRAASAALRDVVQVVPAVYPAFEPAVRILAAGWPVWLLLETLAGLALAWQGHALVARTPLGPPLAARPRPDRDSRAAAWARRSIVLNH